MQETIPITVQQQHQNSPHPRKGTPGRRRHNRQPSQPHGRKTYASENDMPSDVPTPIDFISGGPFTPQKSATNSPAPSSQQNNSRSKVRNGAKPRPKNVDTSPGPSKVGRKTPPYTAGPKSSSAAAFAGATFHASPAPSSLPIPSFLANKALDSPTIKETGRISQEPSPPVTDSETPTPQHQADIAKDRVQDSPLDVFFRADRAERERARRASSATALAAGPGPFSPPLQKLSPPESKTVPQVPSGPQSRRAPFSRNSPGIPTMELDGTPGRPMGPAFSTPYHDRIRAVRTSDNSPSSVHGTTQKSLLQQQQSPSGDGGEQLMKFLGIQRPSDSPTPQISTTQNYASASPARQTLNSAVPHTHPVTGSQTFSKRGDSSRPAEFRQMEDNLRKMLKIDGLNLGSTPAAMNYQSS